MMTRLQKIRDELLIFHRDQRGESGALGNVMMLAVAAMVMVALIAFGQAAYEWLRKQWLAISGSKIG